jgi:hypothetical protein
MKGLNDPQKSAFINDLFKGSGGTIQARRFFDPVFRNFDKYKQYTKEMENSSGQAQKAFETMAQTPQAKFQNLKNQFHILAIEMGTYLLPYLGDVADGIATVVEWFNNLSPSTKKIIAIIFGLTTAFFIVAGIIMVVVGGFVIMAGAMAAAGITIGGLAAAVGIALVVIAALVAIGIVLYKNWATVGPIFHQVWDAIERGAKASIPIIIAYAKQAYQWLINIKNAAIQAGQWLLRTFGPPIVAAAKTLWGAIQSFWGSLQRVYAVLKQNVMAGWASMMQKIGPSLDQLQGKFKAALPSIMIVVHFLQWAIPMAAKIAGFWIKALGKYYEGLFQIVAPIIQGLMSAIGSFVAMAINMFGHLIQFLSGWVQLIDGILHGNFGQMWEGIKNIFAGGVGMLIDLWRGAKDMLIAIVKGVVMGIVHFFEWLWDELVGHSIIPDMINAIVRWFRSLPGRLFGVIKGMISSIIGFFQAMPGRIIGALNRLGGLLQGLASRALHAMAGAVAQGIISVIGWFRSLPGRAYSAAVNIIARLIALGRSALYGMLRGIQAGAQVVWGFFKSLPGRIVAAIPNPLGMLVGVGEDIMRGLEAGIDKMASVVAQHAASVGVGIKTGIEHALGIHSPSTVMKQIGVWTIAGLILGLEQKSADLRKTVANVGVWINNAFRKGIGSLSTKTVQSTFAKLRNELYDIRDEALKGIKDKSRINDINTQFRRLVMSTMDEQRLFVSIAAQRGRIADQLAAANKKLTAALKLRDDYYNSVRDAVNSYASIINIQAQTDDMGNEMPLTGEDLISGLTDRLKAIREFQANLKKLMAEGLNKTTYKQLVDAGVDGGSAYAEALASAGPAAIKKINQLQQQIGTAGKGLAFTASRQLYQAGVDAAQGLVDGLKKKERELDLMMTRLANTMVAAIRHALGIHSPSKVFHLIGANLGGSLARGIRAQFRIVKKAAHDLSAAATPPQPGMSFAGVGSRYGYLRPVEGDTGRPVVHQNITVNTQEIDPTRHAAQLGWQLAGRTRF